MATARTTSAASQSKTGFRKYSGDTRKATIVGPMRLTKGGPVLRAGSEQDILVEDLKAHPELYENVKA